MVRCLRRPLFHLLSRICNTLIFRLCIVFNLLGMEVNVEGFYFHFVCLRCIFPSRSLQVNVEGFYFHAVLYKFTKYEVLDTSTGHNQLVYTT